VYDPYEHAFVLDIEVIHRKIRTANAMWLPDHNVIVIRDGMKASYDQCALAHEIGHAALGHADDSPKNEVLADRYAAERMVEADRCRDLMRWAPDIARLALELGVTTRLLRAYLRMHPVNEYREPTSAA